MIGNGDLARRITEEGLRGITSNPSIFEEAITEGAEYDEEIAQAAAAGRPTAGLYEELITSDVRDACDRLRPLYDSRHPRPCEPRSLASPRLVYNNDASVEEARRLWKIVNRPNLLIKIQDPGTPAGVPAVEPLLFEGINVQGNTCRECVVRFANHWR